MNRGFLIGRLGADVEVRTASNNKTYARLRVANNYPVRSADGEGWDEGVNWTTVAVFGKLAQSLRRLGKGSLVAIEYRLQEQIFEKGDVKLPYSQPVAVDVDFLVVKKPAGSSDDESDAPADDAAAEPAETEDGAEDES